MAKELKNKPLIEAIVEIKWKLQGEPAIQIDPHYKILLGRLYDRLQGDYPEHQPLQTANMPDELVGQTVQHQFRVAADKWPLIQVGPGILTVNSTDDYTWEDFRTRTNLAVNTLYEAYPKTNELHITSLVLRYIDAVGFNYFSEDVLDFIRDKLKVNILVPQSLFEDTGVDNKTSNFVFQGSYKCGNPTGLITLRLGAGQKNNAPVVVWETIFESLGDDLPEMPGEYGNWLEAAHKIAEDWFFKMIEGDLERSFSGD